MKELSMHIHDLVGNALAAGASRVSLAVSDSLMGDQFGFTIADDGHGMPPNLVAAAFDPYTTTRASRHVGLGLPLVKMNAERCGGGVDLQSEPNVGTTIHFWFRHSHIDRPPMGDFAGTFALLVATYPIVGFHLEYRTDAGCYEVDSRALCAAAGCSVRIDYRALQRIVAMLTSHLTEIKANN